MASLSTDFDLDASAALSTLDSFSTSLDTVVSSFASGLSEALDNLSSISVGAPDTSAVTSALEDSITTAAEDTTPTVTVTADTSQVGPEIDSAVSDTDATITVEADTTAAQASIDELTASADDAAGGGGGGGGGGGLSGLGSAASELTGSFAGATSAAGGLTEGIGGVAEVSLPTIGTVAGVTAGIADLAKEGVGAEGAQQRLTAATGAYAKQLQTVNINGTTESLSKFALSVGSTDEGIENATAHIFTLGTSSGAAAPEVAKTTSEIQKLAANAVAARPSLGDVGDVADRMTKALATGGPRAVQYGIALTSAQIAARALQIATADGRTEVTQWDKVTAGAQLTTEAYGKSLDTNITKNSQNAEVQLKSMTAQFSEALEEFGKPLVAPAFAFIQAFEPIAVSVFSVLGKLGEAILPGITPIVGAISEITTSIAGPLNKALTEIAPSEKQFGEELGKLFTATAPLIISVVDILADAAPVISVLLKSFSNLIAGITGPLEPIIKFGQAIGLIPEASKTAVTGLGELSTATQKASQAQQDNAKETLGALVSSGKLTAGQVTQAEKTTNAKSATIDYVGALGSLQTAQSTAAATIPTLNAALGTTSTSLAGNTQAWTNLALAINNGNVTSDEFPAVAQRFGVSAADIETFAGNVTSAIQTMDTKSASALDDMGSAFVINFAKFDPAATTQAFEQQATAIQNFATNISQYAHVFPQLVADAIKAGPEAGGAALDSLKTNSAVQNFFLEKAAEDQARAGANLTAAVTNAAPGFVAANAAMAQQGSEPYGQVYGPTALAGVTGGVASLPQAFTGKEGFGFIQSANLFGANSASSLGTGYGSQLDFVGPQLATKGAALSQQVANGADSFDFFGHFSLLGLELDRGLAAGISGSAGLAITAATSLAISVTNKTANLFGVKSPSTVWRDQIGVQLGLGLAEGITSTTGIVNAAALGLASSATSAASSGISNASFRGVGAGSAASSGGGTVINISVPVTAAPGMTTAQAQALGTTTGNAVGTALGTRLSGRQILATVRAS